MRPFDSYMAGGYYQHPTNSSLFFRSLKARRFSLNPSCFSSPPYQKGRPPATSLTQADSVRDPSPLINTNPFGAQMGMPRPSAYMCASCSALLLQVSLAGAAAHSGGTGRTCPVHPPPLLRVCDHTASFERFVQLPQILAKESVTGTAMPLLTYSSPLHVLQQLHMLHA